VEGQARGWIPNLRLVLILARSHTALHHVTTDRKRGLWFCIVRAAKPSYHAQHSAGHAHEDAFFIKNKPQSGCEAAWLGSGRHAVAYQGIAPGGPDRRNDAASPACGFVATP
jgi:hypothetical protein